MTQANNKHEPVHPAPPKKVGEPESLVMPLADPGPLKPTPTIGVKGAPIEDGERDPDTIAEEQRRRSAEYEAGIAATATNKAPLPPPEHHASRK